MKLKQILETKRRDLRLFHGLQSLGSVPGIIHHGLLTDMDRFRQNRIFFTDEIRKAYNYQKMYDEPAHAIVEVLVSANHHGLVNSKLERHFLSNHEYANQTIDQEIDPQLRKHIDQYKKEPWMPYNTNTKNKIDKLRRLTTQYGNATKQATSDDMYITHNIGFSGRPRIVAIYRVETLPNNSRIIVDKFYDRGEGSYEIGYTF